MKILAVHNYYQQRGGEDQCFEDEIDVLRSHGHTVVSHIVHNDSIQESDKWKIAIKAIWNSSEYNRMLHVIQNENPDVLHAVNTFPLFSPSIFYAAKKLKVPVVHEVANYRIACAGTFLLRDGKICEKCIRACLPVSAIRHKCYRDSRCGSTAVASSIVLHRVLRTWHRVIDLFTCPSQICRTKLIESGLPGDKIIVKPNVLNFDPGMGEGPQPFVVFVGRLSPEKGLTTLLQAWQDDANLPVLKIIGDGPLSSKIQSAQTIDSRIQWLGRMPVDGLLSEVGKATCLVMPSIWYEPFGRTTIEAFATGTPVIGSRIGGTAEIVTDGKNGWLFTPGDSRELAAKVHLVMNLPAEKMKTIRSTARKTFLEKYTAENNYQMLMDAYKKVLAK